MSLVVVVLSATAGTGDSNGGETHTHWLIMLRSEREHGFGVEGERVGWWMKI